MPVSVAIATLPCLDRLDASMLSDSELARIAAISNPVVRRRSRGGSLLLAQLLSREFGGRCKGQLIRRAPDGRPACDQAFVSISHSQDWVACAVAKDTRVGVDVQIGDPKYDRHGIARAFFTSAETEWLALMPPESFWSVWVLKEAYLKARGEGIFAGLKTISLRIVGAEIQSTTLEKEMACLSLFQQENLYLGIALVDPAPAQVEGLELLEDSIWRPWSLSAVATGITRMHS